MTTATTIGRKLTILENIIKNNGRCRDTTIGKSRCDNKSCPFNGECSDIISNAPSLDSVPLLLLTWAKDKSLDIQLDEELTHGVGNLERCRNFVKNINSSTGTCKATSMEACDICLSDICTEYFEYYHDLRKTRLNMMQEVKDTIAFYDVIEREIDDDET